MVKTLLIALLILPLWGCDDNEIKNSQSLPVQEIKIVSQNGKMHIFQAELALTQEEKMTGLMFREEMSDDRGMLFFFGPEQELRFWMKNTLIPLDMIFIKADGTIHHIHENAIPHDLSGAPSNGKVSGVFEINGGLARKLGISVGDKLKHELFNRSNTQ